MYDKSCEAAQSSINVIGKAGVKEASVLECCVQNSARINDRLSLTLKQVDAMAHRLVGAVFAEARDTDVALSITPDNIVERLNIQQHEADIILDKIGEAVDVMDRVI